MKLQIKTRLKHSEKSKHKNTWVSWRLTWSDKWRWKKKLRKNISGERESYSRQNSVAETIIKGINTWAVTLVRYSGPFLKWTREELKQMDHRTRKLMTMHKELHPRRWHTICIKKSGRKRTCQHWRQRWCNDTTTQELHRKGRRMTDYSHQKRY